MTVRRVTRLLLVAGLILSASGGAAAARQATKPAAPKPAPMTVVPLPSAGEKVPVDRRITIGRLPNGLRYYVRRNPRPAKRAELRLVINVGSVLEDDDQLGLAHFVEHMAFNGTTHFQGQEITGFMESIGMQFGPNLNAFTTFDDTTFVLQVPTDRNDILEKAFLILEDWAHNVTFDGREIDKERGVIVEEWRQGRGASARLQDKLFPIVLEGSRYGVRNPIGTKASIESFPHERLKQFYRDWYRPDLMAVVAVGDFDPPAIEALIRKRFSAIPAPIGAKPRPAYPVPDHPGTRYAIATDPELPAATISIFNKLPIREQSTILSYRERIIDHLYAAMFNARLNELSQRADAPFIGAGVDRGIFVRTKEVAMLSAMSQPDRIGRALEAVVTEAARVERHGFTATELEREKRNLLRAYDQALAENDKDESAPLAAEYIRNFLTDESLPGIAWEHEMHVRFLPGITLADVNALAKEWNGDHSRVVAVSAPQKAGLAVPAEADLAAIVKKASAAAVAAYVDDTPDAALLSEAPAPGAIAAEKTLSDVGVTEWTLSNGARVVLYPTAFKQDEVFFRAVSPGGASLAPDADYVAAATSGQVVSAGGLGAFDAVALDKVLAGKVATVLPFIEESFEGLAGGGSARDIETLLQLVYLRFTKPRADATAYGVMVEQLKSIAANRGANPETLFEDTVAGIVWQNHFRKRPISAALIQELSLEKSFEFYKDRFADAGDFVFVFAGNIDVAAMRPLVTRYLASLPTTGRKETWRDTAIDPVRGVVERVVEKGLEPQSRVRLVFTGPFSWNPTQRVLLTVLGKILEGQLGAVLREDQSGTYGVRVTTASDKVPKSSYALSIDFSCAPERTEDLVRRLFLEIARVRMEELSEPYLRGVREALVREFETDSRENRWAVARITDAYENGDDVRDALKEPGLNRALTSAMIQEAARLYLDTRNYVRVTLRPEKK
jgi:zinc protease